ncbi:MAG: hypothetical protein AB7K64_00185 [Variibacter sp.]
MKRKVESAGELRLADSVYKELERLIVTTEIAPGEWVTEESLGQIREWMIGGYALLGVTPADISAEIQF